MSLKEYLYVKMTAKLSSPKSKSFNRKRSRWPTLDQLRPKLKRNAVMETSLEEDQLSAGTYAAISLHIALNKFEFPKLVSVEIVDKCTLLQNSKIEKCV